jgi:hypothetical protein
MGIQSQGPLKIFGEFFFFSERRAARFFFLI